MHSEIHQKKDYWEIGDTVTMKQFELFDVVVDSVFAISGFWKLHTEDDYKVMLRHEEFPWHRLVNIRVDKLITAEFTEKRVSDLDLLIAADRNIGEHTTFALSKQNGKWEPDYRFRELINSTKRS